MKKVILSVVTTVFFTSTIAMSDEFFVGGGYDFHRKTSKKIDGRKKFKSWVKLGMEWIPFENNDLKLGIGISHSLNIKAKSKNIERVTTTPIYAFIKPEWKINEAWGIYNKYRVGWSFNSKKENVNSYKDTLNLKFKSGPYVGIEVGAEWKNFSVGLAYDMNYFHKSSSMNQIGITLGYTFGEKNKSYKKITHYIESSKNIKNNNFNDSKIIPVEIQSVTNPKNIEERMDTRQNSKKDYKKWFSFDEEINK